MKILHIPNYYPPYIGGIGEVCYYLANCLVGENNIEQKVLCFNDQNKRIFENLHGVDIVRARSLAQIKRQQVSIDLFFLMRKLMNEFNPDIVHFHMPNPLGSLYLLLCLPKETKLIVHWHSDIVGQDFVYSLIKRFESAVLKRSDLILMTSPLYASHSLPLQPFLNKVDVLPNIISKEKVNITPEVKLEALKIRKKYNNRPIIFTIGRHVPYKGIEYLIKAESLIKSDCVILIGGYGILTEELKELAKGRNRINFIGFLPDKEMIEHMYASDIFAFPSITKNEAFGIALAEAMYCGAVPVTFTIAGSGVNYVSINGVTGIEVPNKDYKAFANAVDTLVNNNILYSKYQANGIKRVEENFTLESIKDKLLNIYNNTSLLN